MSLKKRLVSGAAALALVGTAALALDIAKDGAGDYLIAPVYVATGGWKTDIKVVNTNTTQAIVAKVVIRDGASSKEVLDFPIYLTPGDVWSGTIYVDGNNVKIKSDDDSLMLGMDTDTAECDQNGVTTFIPIIKPVQLGMDQELNNPEGAQLNSGYVEIFGLAKYDAAAIANIFGVNWTEGCDLNKTWFYTVARDFANPDDLKTSWVAPSDVSNNDLLGEQVIINEAGASAKDMRFMKLNLFALEDVATEAKTDDVIGADTKLANVADVQESDFRNLFKKQHVYVMYDGDGDEVAPFKTIFTFPYMKNVETVSKIAGYRIGTDKIVFRDYEEHASACNVPGIECATLPCQVVDQDPKDPTSDLSGREENKTCCPKVEFTKEVSVVVDGAKRDPDYYVNQYAFKVGGYIDIDLSEVNLTVMVDENETNVTDSALPVIPTTMSARKVGDIYLNNHLYNQYAGPSTGE